MCIYKNFQLVYLHHSLAPVLSSLSPSFSCVRSGIQSCIVPERLLHKDLLLLEKSLFELMEALHISLFGLNA